jgi:hypothetical protein
VHLGRGAGKRGLGFCVLDADQFSRPTNLRVLPTARLPIGRAFSDPLGVEPRVSSSMNEALEQFDPNERSGSPRDDPLTAPPPIPSTLLAQRMALSSVGVKSRFLAVDIGDSDALPLRSIAYRAYGSLVSPSWLRPAGCRQTRGVTMKSEIRHSGLGLVATMRMPANFDEMSIAQLLDYVRWWETLPSTEKQALLAVKNDTRH